MKCIYELILGNYARCTYLLQSPRSGKFVSNNMPSNRKKAILAMQFQSPRSGKFVSNVKGAA